MEGLLLDDLRFVFVFFWRKEKRDRKEKDEEVRGSREGGVDGSASLPPPEKNSPPPHAASF